MFVFKFSPRGICLASSILLYDAHHWFTTTRRRAYFLILGADLYTLKTKNISGIWIPVLSSLRIPSEFPRSRSSLKQNDRLLTSAKRTRRSCKLQIQNIRSRINFKFQSPIFLLVIRSMTDFIHISWALRKQRTSRKFSYCSKVFILLY